MNYSFSQLLGEIGLNASEKKVYLTLVKLWQWTVGDIYKNCELPRTTIKSVLDRLFEKWLLVKQRHNWTLHYWVDSLENYEKDLYKKIQVTKELDSFIRQIYKTNSHIPWVKIYDKTTNIRGLIESFRQNIPIGSDIYTIDCPWSKNYLLFFTQEEFEEMLKRKKKRKIHTYSLIPFWVFDTIYTGTLESQDICLFELPEQVDFRASMWLIEWKVVFFSGQTNIIIEITNPVIYMSMKSIYDLLRSLSKQIYKNF